MADQYQFSSKDINDILAGLEDQGADISKLEKVLKVGACETEWLTVMYDCFAQVNIDGRHDEILRDINSWMARTEIDKILED